MNCESTNTIYLITCMKCLEQYVSSTIMFRIHKSDMKTKKDNCGYMSDRWLSVKSERNTWNSYFWRYSVWLLLKCSRLLMTTTLIAVFCKLYIFR